MAAVDIFDVKVLDNPAPFRNPLQFEITYDVREALKEGKSRHASPLFPQYAAAVQLIFVASVSVFNVNFPIVLIGWT